jgi:hypothetical protein
MSAAISAAIQGQEVTDSADLLVTLPYLQFSYYSMPSARATA